MAIEADRKLRGGSVEKGFFESGGHIEKLLLSRCIEHSGIWLEYGWILLWRLYKWCTRSSCTYINGNGTSIRFLRIIFGRPNKPFLG
jgi:hypothetical protein